MKTSELRQKDTAGLQTEIKELQKATQQLTNTAQMKVARRSIARAKTILAEQQAKAKE
jgi:large subunit ribosomal protein L29